MTKKTIINAIFASSIWLLSSHINAAPQLIDRIVAIAGEDVVMLSELATASVTLQQKLRAANVSPMPSQATIQSKALNQLISEKLQLAEAETLGISADEATLNQALNRVAKNNNVSLAELRSALQQQGVSYTVFRENIRKQIILARLKNNEINNTVQVTKAEIDQHLSKSNAQTNGRESVRISHILIETPDGASPKEIAESKSKALRIYQQLRSGTNFAQVAQYESDGRQALNGGDLGWMSISDIPTLFVDLSLTLNKGEVATPIQSKSGFHIIKLEDFEGGDREIVQQTLAHHILVKTDEVTTDEQAENKLWVLRERILLGENFAALAKSHSHDAGSAIKGGSLGWVNPGIMVPDFEKQMHELPVGEISSPFQSPFGWHLLYVEDRRHHDATDQSLRDKARKTIRERKGNEAWQQRLRRLRDEAYIELRLQDLDSA